MKVKPEEVNEAFRERLPKDDALLLKLSSKAKKIIEQVAHEQDMDASAFIRQAIKNEIIRFVS